MQTLGTDWSGTRRFPGREEGFMGHLRSHWYVDGGGTSVEIGSRLKIKHGSEEKREGKIVNYLETSRRIVFKERRGR